MTTEDLLILRFCTVDDWVQDHGLPGRPGPTPACSDSEILTFALARELLGYDSERRFRRVLLADGQQLFPHVPAQSELNRRTRWLCGALEILRQHWVADIAAAAGDWVAYDTTPLPVKHPGRVRHADQWVGPDGLHAGCGRCAAQALWFYGFRIAVVTPLLTPVPLVWVLAPAAVNERTVAIDLQLLADKGLRGTACAAQLAEQGITPQSVSRCVNLRPLGELSGVNPRIRDHAADSSDQSRAQAHDGQDVRLHRRAPQPDRRMLHPRERSVSP